MPRSIRITAKQLGRIEYYSAKLAQLLKLFDMREACLLVQAAILFPADFLSDIDDIIRCARENDVDSIKELFEWYRYRAIAVAAGSVSGLRPKKSLSIFARRRAQHGKKSEQRVDKRRK